MVKRLENWPILLSEFIASRRKMKFCWGENDCLIFTGKAVEAITGQNFYQDYVGMDSEEKAQEVLNKEGGLIKIISKHLGEPHRFHRMARRGDVVAFKSPLLTAGIVDDTGAKIISVGKDGIVTLPLRAAIRIWRV